MALWIKTLATKPDDFNLIPGTHVVKREDQLLCKLSSGLYIHAKTHIYAKKLLFKKILVTVQ